MFSRVEGVDSGEVEDRIIMEILYYICSLINYLKNIKIEKIKI